MNIRDITCWDETKGLADGEIIKIRGVVKEVTEEPSKTGTYVKIWAHDGKAPFYINIFNITFPKAQETYVANQIYDFVLQLKLYGSEGRPVVKQVITAGPVHESLADTKRFKPWSFVRLTDENRHAFMTLYTTLISKPSYRRYIEVAYGLGERPESVSPEKYETRRKAVTEGFASINRHDSYPGGYTNHVMGMLRIAMQLKELYADGAVGRIETVCNVDWDYVFTGIYLHDVGKQATYASMAPGLIKFRPDTKVDHNISGCILLSFVHSEVEPAYRMEYMEYQNFLYTIQFHDTVEKLYAHKRVEDKIISLCDGMDSILSDALEL